MTAADDVGQLYRQIVHYRLDARYAELAGIRAMIEEQVFPADMAYGLLLSIADLVSYAKDHPNVLSRPPTFDELYGDTPPDIRLGSLADVPDIAFGLRFGDRPRAVSISGNSGSGKTTSIANIVTRTDELGKRDPSRRVSIIVRDTKLDYAHLPDELGPNWVRLSVHDGGTRLGLNAPQGVPASAWINLIASIFCARAGLIAAWTCFANMTRWLLDVLNPKTSEQLRWPSLKLLLEITCAAPLETWAAKADYGKSLVQVLEAATQATNVFDCFSGLDLERDIIRPGKSLVLEMPNVTPAWLRQFMFDVLLAQLLCGRIHRHQKMDRTDVMAVMDEADQDATADSDRRFPDQMSPLSQLLRMGREYGIMSVIGMGRIYHASPYVLSEPQYHLVFNQSDGNSVLTARRLLLLPAEADAMFPALRPGECIARESQGTWPHPMLVNIDYRPPGRGVVTRPYDTHPVVPAVNLEEMPEVIDALDELVTLTRRRRLSQTRRGGRAMSKHAHALLHAASIHPWSPVARLWEKTDVTPSPDGQAAARRDLEERGMAAFEQVRIGRANVLLIGISRQGYEYLNRDMPTHQGRGGISHQHLAAWIAMAGERRGHTVRTEWLVPGTQHPVDAAWHDGDAWHVFECVVSCERNLVAHIHSCFGQPGRVASLTIVFLQKAVRERVRKQLQAAPDVAAHLEHVRFDVAATYLQELWS